MCNFPQILNVNLREQFKNVWDVKQTLISVDEIVCSGSFPCISPLSFQSISLLLDIIPLSDYICLEMSEDKVRVRPVEGGARNFELLPYLKCRISQM